jgi:hypothetical protein
VLADLKSIGLRHRFKIFDGVSGVKLEGDGETPCGLDPVDVGLEWNHKFGLIPFHRHRMLILHLNPLGAKYRNGHDARGELLARRRTSFVGRTFAHLQKPGIDGLRFGLFVDFSCAAPLQNDAGDPGDIVPDGEIGDGGLVGQRELVNAFLNGGAMVPEDLPQTNTRSAVIDSNVQRHFVERENCWVRLLAIARNKHA